MTNWKARRGWAIAGLSAVPALLLLVVLLPRGARDRLWGVISGRPDRPAIWVDPPRIDFGRVKPLAELDAVFTVGNAGSQVLKLNPPTATCGCQKPAIDRLVLWPGERATLRVHQQVRQAVGNVRQMVLLNSNDPIAAEVAIPMDLVVTKGLIVRPEPVYLGQIPAGESATRSVEVVSDDGVPFKITHCGAGAGNLEVDAEFGRLHVYHRVNIKYRAGDQLGPFEERFVVAVDRTETAPLVIPVKGEVRGSFAAAPSKLSLGSLAGLSETDTSLTISGPGAGIRVVDVKISPDDLYVKYNYTIISDGRRVRLRLKIRVPNSGGTLDPELRLLVSGDGEKPVVLKVPILASVHSTGGSRVARGH